MKKAAPCLFRDADGECSQAKNGPRHFGLDADHEYEPEPKPQWGSQRQPINPQSQREGRVERRQKVSETRQRAHAGPRYCVAHEHGIESPCGIGDDATLEASHVIGLGMGGGAEHGEAVLLCRKHHRELDTDRQAFRDAGLSKPAPRPAKVVPRPAESTPDRPRPVRRR